VQIGRAHDNVMRRGEVLAVVVSLVELAFAPENVKLALADSIADPIVAHVDGLGAFLFDSVVRDADGSAVVGGDGSGWLGPIELLQAD